MTLVLFLNKICHYAELLMTDRNNGKEENLHIIYYVPKSWMGRLVKGDALQQSGDVEMVENYPHMNFSVLKRIITSIRASIRILRALATPFFSLLIMSFPPGGRTRGEGAGGVTLLSHASPTQFHAVNLRQVVQSVSVLTITRSDISDTPAASLRSTASRKLFWGWSVREKGWRWCGKGVWCRIWLYCEEINTRCWFYKITR